MNDEVFLGIDTSNYTTSLALCGADGRIIFCRRTLLSVDGRGLRQSDALFQHIKNLPKLFAASKDELSSSKIAAVAYSAYPRDAADSYMPCFLAGEAAASAAASALGVPLYPFSHQAGHIMAAVASCGEDEKFGREFIAFHVSGGTTEILRAVPNENGYDIELIGGTRDLNAGQAVDRVGVALGIAFPCGRELEKLAVLNKKTVPKPKISVEGYYCNLSGLENLALKLYDETGDRELCAAYVLEFVGDTILALAQNLKTEYAGLPVIYAGGVMSNAIIRAKISARFEASFAQPEYSSDNAAGTALLGRRKYILSKRQNVDENGGNCGR